MSEHIGDLQEQKKPIEIKAPQHAPLAPIEEQKQAQDVIFQHDYKEEEKQQNGANQPPQAPLQEEQKRQHDLQVTIKKVNSNMPEPLPVLIRQKLTSRKRADKGRQPLPKALDGLLDQVSSWRKVKAETSAPVKEMAQQLKDAENDAQAAQAMALLYNAGVSYLYKNEGKWFKSADRKREVADILNNISQFLKTDVRSEYLDQMDKQLLTLREAYGEDTNVFRYVEALGRETVEAEGEVEVDTLRSRTRKRQEKEAGLEAAYQSADWATIEQGAKSIIKERQSKDYIVRHSRPTEEFKHFVSSKAEDTQENRKKDAELCFKKIMEYNIPDLSKVGDFELLTDNEIRQFVDVDYRIMVNDANRLIAFGYAKDYNEIKKIKSQLLVMNMQRDIYKTRLNVLAGQVPAQSLEGLTGYGKTRAQQIEEAKEILDHRSERNLDTYKQFYEAMHGGRKATTEELEARRLLIEKRTSFKRYLASGAQNVEDMVHFPKELVKKGGDVRHFEGVVGYGKATAVKRIPITDKDGNVTGFKFEERERTKEEADQLVKDIQSKDVVKKFGAYRAVLDDFLHTDYSLFYDTSSEEKLFENYQKKSVFTNAANEIYKILNQIQKEYDNPAVTDEQKAELKKLGFPLSQEEDSEIRAVSDMLATYSQYITSMNAAMMVDNAELVTLEDLDTIEDTQQRELYKEGNIIDSDLFTHPAGEQLNIAFLGQLSAKNFRSTGVKIGENISDTLNTNKYRHFYAGFKSILEEDEIKKAFDRQKDLKGEEIRSQAGINKAIKMISKYTKPITELSRKEVLENINEIRQARLQCDELEKHANATTVPLTPEEVKEIQAFKADYENKLAYIEKYARLVNSKVMADFHNFGFRLDSGDSFAPNMTSSKLADLKKICMGKDREAAFELWKGLVELWPLLAKGEPEAAAHIDSVIHSKEMDAATLEKHQSDYDAYRENNEAYLTHRAQKENITISDNVMNLVSSLRLVKEDANADNTFDTAKVLSIDTANCTQEEFMKKVSAIEDILKFMLLFDAEDFTIKEGTRYNGKIDTRFAKIKLAGQVQGLYDEYKKLITDKRFPEGSSFGGDFELQNKIRYGVGAFASVADRFANKDIEKVNDKLSVETGDLFKHAEDEVKAAIERKKVEEERQRFLAEEEKKRKELEAAKEKERQKKLKKQQEEEQRRQQKAEKEAQDAQAAGDDAVDTHKRKLNKKQEYSIKRRKMKAANKIKRKAQINAAIAHRSMNEAMEKLKSQAEIEAERQQQILANVTLDKSILTVEEKQRNAKRLDLNFRASVDNRIRFREMVPLDVKKKVNYVTYERFSEFAFLNADQKQLEQLIRTYSQSKVEAEKLKKVGKQRDVDRVNFTALNLMTAELMKLDLSKYDVSSDHAIAKNAAELEKVSRAVDAFQYFVQEAGGDNYIKYLREERDDGKLIIDRINKLTSISNYFRTRRLVIEDETYIYKEGADISTEANEKDDFETERLRKLLKYSETFARDIKNAFDPESTVPMPPMEALAIQRKALLKLEDQRYSVAPKWLKESLSMTNLKDHNEDPRAHFAAALMRSNANELAHEYEVEKEGRQELNNFYRKEFPKMLKSGVHGESPTFKGGKDKYLESIDVSDNWSRSYLGFVNCSSYRKSTMEMKEMLTTMKIQDSIEWDKIKDDPEAVAFYESAFKEMAMREIAGVFANVKRIANSVGYKILLMHPVDLAMQVTTKLRMELMGAVMAANIDEGEESHNDLRKLFGENNTEGRYDFDVDEFHELGALTGEASWKACNNGRVFHELLNGIFESSVDEMGEDVDVKDIQEKIFGDRDIEKKQKAEHQKAIEKDPINNKYFDGEYYMVMHPEFYTMKNMLTKTSNGKYVFGHEMETNVKSYLSEPNLQLLRRMMKNKRVKQLDPEEIKAYEKSLQDRNMPKLVRENDPWGIKGYFNQYEDYIKKDKTGAPVIDDKTGEYKMVSLLGEKKLQW